MKKNKSIKNSNNFKSRRKFLKKIGIGILATSSYSLFSLTNFACSDSVTSIENYSYKNYSGYSRYGR